MKKPLFITLLLAYLFSATEMQQFLKLPLLFEHYNEHKALNQNISFFDFLSIHYYNVQEHGTEHETDQKLPFKSLAGSHFLNLPGGYQSTPLSPEPLASPAFYFQFTGEPAICLSFHNNIWQPPKLV